MIPVPDLTETSADLERGSRLARQPVEHNIAPDKVVSNLTKMLAICPL
jgi:hypothetical protein